MAIRTLIKGMGLGAGLMYLWDPVCGRRRRSRILDQWDHAVHCTQDYLDKAQRDASNRASGLSAQACSLLHHDTADDAVIAARVRSKLGRYSSHPRAIAVDCRGGHVILSGPTLEAEVGDLLKAVCSVTGVKGVENRLEVYNHRGNISALQGGEAPSNQHAFDFLQDDWSPATRAVGQVAGMALMTNCMTSSSLASRLLGVVGLGLFVRATTNRGLGQLVGIQSCPQSVRFQRSVTIHAPVEKVWDFLSDFEEVGRFLPVVKSVENLGDGYYRWGLNLPGGQEMEIEERVTQNVPQERLSWESVSEYPVSYRGTLSLQSEGEDSTRVNIRFDYMPPGGKLGAALASWLGVDAKGQFQEAVKRIKPFLETGHAPHDLHEVRTGNPGKTFGLGHSQAGPSEPGPGQVQPAESQTGQPQWVQGQPQRPSEAQPGQMPAAQIPPGQLPPVEIPPVHVETQPSPNQPERGRLG